MDKRLYSIQEIAGIMGCSYRTVQRLIKSKKLGHIAVGRLKKISSEHLESYLSTFGETAIDVNSEKTAC